MSDQPDEPLSNPRAKSRKGPIRRKGEGGRTIEIPNRWYGDYVKHPLTSADYERLLYLLAHADRAQDVADRLGVSTRTLRRWKREGIPPSRFDSIHAPIVKEASNARRRVRNYEKTNLEKPEPRLLKFDKWGATHYWVEGADRDAVFELMLKSALKRRPVYTGFYFQLRLEGPARQVRMEKGIPKEVSGSLFGKIKYFNTRLKNLQEGPDFLGDELDTWFYLPNAEIIKLVITPQTDYEGSDDDEEDY